VSFFIIGHTSMIIMGMKLNPVHMCQA
jgi:hypothetical protein